MVIVWFGGQVVMTGGVTSFTVTVAVQVEVLLDASVAVSVTVLPPAPPQLKVVGVMETVGVPQLSVEPLFTCAAVTEAELPTRLTETFWHLATGAVLSMTVTMAIHWPWLPLASCKESVTTLLVKPTCEQLKVLGVSVIVAIPQASVELLFTWAAVTVTLLPTRAAVTF